MEFCKPIEYGKHVQLSSNQRLPGNFVCFNCSFAIKVENYSKRNLKKKINHILDITVIPTRGTSPVVPQNGTDKCHLKMPRKPHNSVDNPLSWRFSPASDQQDQNSNEPPPPYPIMTQTGVTNYSPSIPNRQSPTSTTDGKHKFRLNIHVFLFDRKKSVDIYRTKRLRVPNYFA